MPFVVKRAADRHHERWPYEESWTSFDARDPHDLFAARFEPLRSVREVRLPRLQRPQRPAPDADILTYVRRGAMVHADPVGRLDTVAAGFFLFTRAAQVIYNELVDAPAVAAHLIQFYFEPGGVRAPVPLDAQFVGFAERSGVLRVVASLNGEDGSMRIPHDVTVCSSLLRPGQHVVYALGPGRCAWLQVVVGKLRMGTLDLEKGDGVGITNAHAVSVVALTHVEILLADLSCGSEAEFG